MRFREIAGSVKAHVLEARERVLLKYRVTKAACAYPAALARLREKFSSGRKLKVLFIVTETAKWKTQGIFDLMRSSEEFEPCIGVSRPDRHFCISKTERIADFMDCVAFFERRSMPVLKLYDPSTGKATKLVDVDADIIFYQQSWFDVEGQLPSDVCKRAISCYVPYFVPNYGVLRLDSQLPLHRLVYLHFVLNDAWVSLYREGSKGMRYAGRFVGSGHPMLDDIAFDQNAGSGNNCVIYAPHCTINPKHTTGGLNYATFLWNGKEILEYARRHREMNWVFKPHPNLSRVLRLFEVMDEEEIKAYYDEWARIGEVVEGGDYTGLFARSSAMVTDCGSFLTEYAATGKPIIHLVSSENPNEPMPPSAKLYSTYYEARNLAEMRDVFALVLERREDPRKKERHAAVIAANLTGGGAASRIVERLKREVLAK